MSVADTQISTSVFVTEAFRTEDVMKKAIIPYNVKIQKSHNGFTLHGFFWDVLHKCACCILSSAQKKCIYVVLVIVFITVYQVSTFFL